MMSLLAALLIIVFLLFIAKELITYLQLDAALAKIVWAILALIVLVWLINQLGYIELPQLRR